MNEALYKDKSDDELKAMTADRTKRPLAYAQAKRELEKRTKVAPSIMQLRRKKPVLVGNNSAKEAIVKKLVGSQNVSEFVSQYDFDLTNYSSFAVIESFKRFSPKS
jgi:hypothetical protein